jgi:mannosyltransferase
LSAKVIHPHLHPRRTGVTRHVESVVPHLPAELGAAVVGRAVDGGLPRIGWREVWRRIRREKVIWHAHRNNELLAGLLLRALGKEVRVVFTRHAATRPGWWTRLLASGADQVVALTQEGARYFGGPRAEIGHGVDLARFQPPKDRSRAWRELGLGGELGLGALGRVRPPKGQGDLVEAVAPLLPRFPSWRAVLVGRVAPRDRGFAKKLRRALGASGALVEEQREVVPWYQGLSVVVQPSHTEGFSLVLLEAMASGCCVVAARLPHFPGLVEDGVTGFLYPPGDVLALRALLERLLADPALVEGVGRAASEVARQRFGVEQEAQALARLYQGLWG